jgi:hypothetical protein
MRVIFLKKDINLSPLWHAKRFLRSYN